MYNLSNANKPVAMQKITVFVLPLEEDPLRMKRKPPFLCWGTNAFLFLPFLSDLKSLTLYDVEEITKYWIKKGCPESTWCYATLLQRFPYTTYPTQYVNLHVYMCDRTIDIKVPPCFLLVALKHFELNIEEKMSFYVKEKEEELSEFTFIRDLPDDEDGTKYVFILPS